MTNAYAPFGSKRGPYTLKYLRLTVDKPYTSLHKRHESSFTYFCRPYGLFGSAGRSSESGSVAWSPYAELEAAYIRRFTPPSLAARKTDTVPITLTSYVSCGFSMENCTRGSAAS